MSKLRDFIGKIPELCGAKQSDVRGIRNQLLFDYEIDNKNSVLKRENFKDDPDSRLDALFDFDGDEKKKKYCRALLNVKMYTGYEDEEKVAENVEVLKAVEAEPSIDAVYSVEEASATVAGPWGWY